MVWLVAVTPMTSGAQPTDCATVMIRVVVNQGPLLKMVYVNVSNE